MESFLKVTQIKSTIRRIGKQRLVLESIGLGKLHRTVFTKNTPDMRGVVQKVEHLVEWEVVDQKAVDAWMTKREASKAPAYSVVPAEGDGEAK